VNKISDSRPKPLVLIILDGWGINPNAEANAIAEASPPYYNSLLVKYPNTTLNASGEAVGLPKTQMGNSEVGHINIGAGRVVHQELTRISKAFTDGTFAENSVFKEALSAAKSKDATFHLLGLLSDGGVHSHIDHLLAILELAAREGLKRLKVHAFLDGRDTPPKSALGYIDRLEKALNANQPSGGDWRIATITGRFYAMDRDKRWERTAKAYHALTCGEGVPAGSAAEGIQKQYHDGISDEFISPIILSENGKSLGRIETRIKEEDSLLFFNFRADRARQLCHALADDRFTAFERKQHPMPASFISMTSYEETLNLPVIFEAAHLPKILAEVLSQQGLRQLRIAETEKYAHVTYFFNGGQESAFEGEERIMIPSPKEVKTYDQKPEMSAEELTKILVNKIEQDRFDFICVNFANPDMVGHSGILSAAVKAVEAVDHSLKKVVGAIIAAGGVALITADHGNLEQMRDDLTGEPHTAHTTFPVPFICVSSKALTLRPGIHANIAPTILDLMKIPKPVEMDHDSLIVT